MLADGEPSCGILGEAVRSNESALRPFSAVKAAGLAKYGDVAGGRPSEDGVFGDVAEEEMSFAAPDGAFSKGESAGELFDGSIGAEQRVKRGVETVDPGIHAYRTTPSTGLLAVA